MLKTKYLVDRIADICENSSKNISLNRVYSNICKGLIVCLLLIYILCFILFDSSVWLKSTVIIGLLLCVDIVFLIRIKTIISEIIAKRYNLVLRVLYNYKVSTLYVLGSNHKLYMGKLKDVVMGDDLLGDDTGIYLVIDGICDKIPLNCVFFYAEEACNFLYEFEKNQRADIEGMIGKEATEQLFKSDCFATWLKEYYEYKGIHILYYTIDTYWPVLKTEDDYVDFLKWLYINKLTKTRTVAKEYETLIKGYKSYCSYVGGCCRLCGVVSE